MLLPNADRATIEPAKLRDYLLSTGHPVGRFKARFFAALGFSAERWQELEEAFRIQHLTQEAKPAGVGILLCFLLAAVFMGLFVAPLQAAVQRRAPANECARIVAAGNMTNAAAAFLGSMSVLVVTETGLDPRLGLLAMALLQGAVAGPIARQPSDKALTPDLAIPL